jgi:VCBS repeat-containing protein
MARIKGARPPFALDVHIETIIPPLPARAAPPHPVNAAVLLPAAGMAYVQNFDTLASSGTASVIPAGWAFSETGVSGNAFYSTGSGIATTGDTYSFGVAGAHAVGDRAFGELRSTTVIPVLGAGFANGTGGAISTLAISYVGEQWRLGALSRTIADRLDFQISFDATSLTTGSWTDINALDFAPAITTGAVGALDGNLAANRVAISFTIAGLDIAAGAGFWIRWIDVDASGADDGLAIDDFALTANGPGALAIDDIARAEGDTGPTSYVFTVLRSGGSAGVIGATWTLVATGGAGAAGGDDFVAGQAPTGTVSFADGETSRTIIVAIAGDLLFEADEGFTILLSAPTGGAVLVDASGAGTILNDDPLPPPTVDLSTADPGTGFAQTWAEGGPGRAIGAAIFVASPGGTILRATITITDALAGDRLDLADVLPAGISASGTGSATLTLTGLASAADYALAIGLVRYASDSDDPDLGGTDAERMIAVVVNDGTQDSAAATATIAIDAQSPATIGGEDSGAVTEDDPAVASGLLTIADPDAGEAALVPIAAGTVGGHGHGTYEVLAGGRWTYTLDNGDAAVQGLGAGATLTDTIMVASADGSASHVITVTIHGANDSAAIGGTDAGTVAEDGALAASGLLTIADADVGESAFEAFAARAGAYGAFSLSAEGAWTYGLDNANAAVQALHDGETLTDMITVTAIDGTTHDLAITIAGSSDTPAGMDRSIAIDEDNVHIFAAADFGFSEPAENDTFAALVIASLPGQGLLLLDGVPVAVGQAIAVAAIEAGRLRFVPAADAHGAPYADFAFQVRDAHGDGDPAPNIVTLEVAPVNDAPAGADHAITIDEDMSYTFAIADFGFADSADDDAFAGLVVTTLPASGTLLLDGAPVGAGQFIAAADIALGGLCFVPLADANGLPYDSFTFQVRDTGGAASGGQDMDQSPNVFTINVTPINDAPANDVPGGQAVNEDEVLILSGASAIRIADVDAGVSPLEVILSAAHGRLTLAAVAGLDFLAGDGSADRAMTFTGTIAAINAALNGLSYAPDPGFNGADAIAIATSDLGGLTDSGTISINVAAVNDAPAGTDMIVAGSENDAYVFTPDDFGFNDGADGDAFLAVRITTLPGAGALILSGGLVAAGQFISAAAIVAGQLSFVPEPDRFGAAYASFTFQVQDDGSAANGGVDLDPTPNLMTIDLVADNDDPALDLDSAAPGIDAALSYTENDGVVAIVPRATLTDDSADFGGGAITLHFADNGTADDQLSIAAGGGIGTSPTDDVLRWNGIAIGFWGGGADGGDLVVQLNADASAAAVEAVLHAFTYANGSEAPSALPRTLTVTVSDGDGGSAAADLVIGVAPVDDAPIAGSDAFATDEATAITAANLFANDADVDGPALVVTAVNGAAAAVGQQIALASGALLTVRADGTFDYDPNHAFDRTPLAASGAANAIAHDGFTYTLANGNSATVALAVGGLDSDDFALGTAGADVIDAGAGSDTIDGLTGADRLAGGAGNDFIFVDGDDVVIEAAGGGYDNVWARASYVLSAGAEVEVLSTANHAGLAAINLVGNEFANVLIGNDGTNLLDGAGGADRLAGRGGDDILIVDGDDVVDEQAGGGYDNVCARSDYVLTAGAFVEVLSTTDHAGTAAINLTGNELANIVIGNAGANILDGGPGGTDRLAGRGGDDVLIVDTGDVVDEQAGGGYDNVCARSTYMLSAGAAIEVLSTTNHAGTAAIDLTGNELANVVLGNAGANVLDGGLGADRLAGFGGADIFAFSTALGAGNVDMIADFDGDDVIRLDHAVFAGLGAGALAAGAFVAGTAAADGDDRILYDAASGQIFYDADGDGANAAILFATVAPATIVTAGDFLVI